MLVEKSNKNASLCKCFSCPSYTTECKIKNGTSLPNDVSKLNHLEAMFCAYEKSNCIHDIKSCKCVECDIYKKYDLNRSDFCVGTGGIL